MNPSKLTLPIQQTARNARRLLSLAWQLDSRLTLLYLFTGAIGALVPLATSYVLKVLIDYLQVAQNSFVTTIPVVIAVTLAARYLVTFLQTIVHLGINQNYLDYVFRYKLQNEIALKFHKRMSDLDIAYFEDSAVQDLITKTRDTMLWRLPDFLRFFSYLTGDIIGFVAAFIVLLPYGWAMPCIVTLVAMPRLYLQAKYGAIQWSLWGSGAPQAKKLWYLNNLLQQATTVKETRISQSSEMLLNKLSEIQQYLFDLNKSALDKYLTAFTIAPIIEAVCIYFFAYQYLPLVIAKTLSIGSFTLLVSMLEQLGSRAANASSNCARLYENGLYVDHYFEFLNLPPLIKAATNPIVLEQGNSPRVEFRNVSFNYPNGPTVLHNISFTVEPGESIALVGQNGAGKTTIIKLLCRFYDASDGEILINGINIKSLDLQSWYSFLGTLFQEFVKFHFTVRENIFLGAPDKRDETAMREAATKSGAADFIERLPGKYDQVLGKQFEDGEELSVGQWQKLAIARAFYEQPPILILDEPTSAIDAEAEYEIFSNLTAQYANKSLILVSHRFSTVRNADKIVVIDYGKIVESGTHEELMRLNGRYSSLFSIQAKGYR